MRASLLLLLTLLPLAAQQDKSLAARVQRLEDMEEIRTVLLDYGRFLDSRDFAAYSRLFAKDGEWVGGFGTVQGPAAIQTFMEKNITGPIAAIPSIFCRISRSKYMATPPKPGPAGLL